MATTKVKATAARKPVTATPAAKWPTKKEIDAAMAVHAAQYACPGTTEFKAIVGDMRKLQRRIDLMSADHPAECECLFCAEARNSQDPDGRTWREHLSTVARVVELVGQMMPADNTFLAIVRK